ncbi:MAG TPA: N-acetyl-1-D-myo-inositol-2-amino-2-deoxy-alpha-D-glucopyranoside deacetylase [Dermatophilaceae bacterium]|nr:N-acetyl-1-D-myo-inositol-2-amino-2-deoxy-alpha-D-glucopyranoside deacetylase [Dermatophilaceae bacterium]
MARLLFAHAHPDDETLATGVALGHYVSRCHSVEVLTATLGDEGEVIPAELAHLTADRDDMLGQFRRGELAAAMARLGVGHRLLADGEGPDGMPRYRDSGMAGSPAASHPRAFAAADVDDAAARVAAYLRAERPDVVVTYDAGGGYGHPDHVQTRRVALAAIAGLAEPERPSRVYEIVTPQSWAREDREWLAQHVPADSGLHVPTLDEPYAVSVVPDEVVTHVVIDDAARGRQAHALAAHRTQVSVFDGYYALSNDIAHRLAGREAFVRLDPATGVRLPAERAGEWQRGLLGEGTTEPVGAPGC